MADGNSFLENFPLPGNGEANDELEDSGGYGIICKYHGHS